MPRKKKTTHFIYKTTCLITNRYYVGMHSTFNLDDGYMGSGRRLKYSIRKHGVENHKREILMFFDNRELLIEGEENFITDGMVNDPNCMNLRKGGTGGFTIEQQRENARKSNIKQKELWDNDSEWGKRKRENLTKGQLKSYEIGNRERFYFYDWNGKTHKQTSKEIIGMKNSIHQRGQGNSQHGTCWITNEVENKKIKKNTPIPFGWKLGRTLK